MIATRDSDGAVAVTASVLPQVPVVLDTQGRLRVSKEQRRSILAALARSGESVPQFARRTGLKYSTLARWVQHHRHTKPRKRQPTLHLLEAVVTPGLTASALQVHLPGGARLELREAGQVVLVAALVRALEKPC